MSSKSQTVQQPDANREIRQHPDFADRPWTLAETSAYLREAERTTRRRAAVGELPAFKLPGGNRLLFWGDDVRRFVAEAAGRSA